MIVTQKKPIDEQMGILGDSKNIAIIGCCRSATS